MPRVPLAVNSEMMWALVTLSLSESCPGASVWKQCSHRPAQVMKSCLGRFGCEGSAHQGSCEGVFPSELEPGPPFPVLVLPTELPLAVCWELRPESSSSRTVAMIFAKCLHSLYGPRPVLSPRDTKVNEADILAVVVVCLFFPFFPSIRSSSLLSDDCVPCSVLRRWECKKCNASLLEDKQINDNTLTFIL